MEFKQVIAVRADLKMGKGKIAAQSSHASLEAYEKTARERPEWVAEWKETGQAKIVVKVGSKKELIELFESAKRELPASLIRDAGRTQLEPGEPTAVGIGPCPESEVNKFTKGLKLL